MQNAMAKLLFGLEAIQQKKIRLKPAASVSCFDGYSISLSCYTQILNYLN